MIKIVIQGGQVCAHMFRHRFITKCFVKLIKQYDLENKDDFRNALMDINSLKTHIQQLTGHINVKSLDHYIDLAKDELTNINAVIDKVSLANAYEAYDRNENDLLRQLENKEITIKEYSQQIKNIKERKNLLQIKLYYKIYCLFFLKKYCNKLKIR